jgi:hypothetical protein
MQLSVTQGCSQANDIDVCRLLQHTGEWVGRWGGASTHGNFTAKYTPACDTLLHKGCSQVSALWYTDGWLSCLN